MDKNNPEVTHSEIVIRDNLVHMNEDEQDQKLDVNVKNNNPSINLPNSKRTRNDKELENIRKEIKKSRVIQRNKIYTSPFCNSKLEWNRRAIHFMKKHRKIHSKIKLQNSKSNSEYNVEDINLISLTLDEGKKFKCPDCAYQTDFDLCIKMHSVNHMEGNLLECPKCKLEFTGQQELMSHLYFNHSRKIQI